jgi:hypothetical protein
MDPFVTGITILILGCVIKLSYTISRVETDIKYIKKYIGLNGKGNCPGDNGKHIDGDHKKKGSGGKT